MRHRDTLSLEDAVILQHEKLPARQYMLRLHSPEIAAAAMPGSFVHIRCDHSLPMRRPMSIMRVDKKHGWMDILYKAHGLGTNLLSKRSVAEVLSVLGPIGKPFKLSHYKSKPLLIGGGVGIPPMIFLAEHIKGSPPYSAGQLSPFVMMGSEVPFPFKAKPSQIMIDGIPPDVIACMPLLEDWGIASRLTSLHDHSGCFSGYVTDLARLWLDTLSTEERAQVEIFTCGPTPMLKAVAALAQEFELPCQVSLEEYMACAVGACAGCAIAVYQNGETSMQRVCVDGPIFDASHVFPGNH